MQRVSADDVKLAASRLAGQVIETPLIQSAALDRRTGGRILVKAECLQVTGSFKFRGALNRLMQLDAVEPGGAVALAAVLSNQIDCRDQRVAVVLSGGNADAASFARWIT